MKYPKLADIKTCTACLACVDACAKQAISLKVGEDGHFYVMTDETKCIGCLRCESICTNIHQRRYGDNNKVSAPFAIYNKEKNFYEKATSGGIFPALASYFIFHCGVVYGAAYTDGIHVAHRRISKIDEIEALQGSKYEQSNMLGIYKSIAEDLKKDLKVLFVGTGCQVAGILSYFNNHRKKSLIYTADLVCGGVPSSLLIESFAKNTPQFAAVNSYIINNTNCQQMDQIQSNLRLSGTESTELVNVKIKAPSSNSYQTIQNGISIQPNKNHYVYYRVYSFPAYESCIGEEPLEMTLLVERQNGCPDVTATYYYGYSSLRGDWVFTTNRSLLD